MLESFSDKVAGLQASCEYCEIFKNTYFEVDLRTAASSDCLFYVLYYSLAEGVGHWQNLDQYNTKL